MQSLASEPAPQTKRRKLDHVPDVNSVQNEDVENLGPDVDHVDEAEEQQEEPDIVTDDILEEDDNMQDSSDPFEAHFAAPDDNILARRLKALELNQWTIEKVPFQKIGKAVIGLPGKEDSTRCAPNTISGPSELKLKSKLANAMSSQNPEFNQLEKHIAPLIFNYQDILYCERSTANSDCLRRLLCLHAINHVFK